MADTHDRQPDTSTLTLRDAFAGVAVAARAIVPFERMGISLLEDPGTVRVHLLAGPGAEHFTEHVLGAATLFRLPVAGAWRWPNLHP